MTILHLYRKGGRFYLWGEAAEPAGDSLSPFDLGARRLGRLLSHGFGDPAAGRTGPVSIPLPTSRAGGLEAPVPSLPFLAEARGLPASPPGERHAVREWPVSAAPLPDDRLMLLLNRCQQRRLAKGLFAGETLLLLADFFRFAGGLVACGRFLPDIAAGRGGAEARWTPVPLPADAARLRLLSASLPSLLLDGQEPGRAGGEIAAGLVDALVRSCVVTTLSEAHARHGHFYSAHDAWFAALRTAGREVGWDWPEDIEALARDVARWRHPVTWQGRAGENLSFRLVMPASDAEGWRLEILIRGGGGVRPFPADLSAEPVCAELLLALGQAALLFPPLAYAEGDGRGRCICHLTRDEAYFFLTGAARTLKGAGYGIEESGADGLSCRKLELVADAVPAAAAGPEGHSLDEKMGVRWSVTLNGETLTPDELKTLLGSSSPLIFFRGQWMIADIQHLQGALRIASKKAEETVTARDILKWALGVEGKNGLDVACVRGMGWLGPVADGAAGGEFAGLPVPEGFSGTLRPYQERGYSWLAFLRGWGFGACLADDMGLGKTVQTLAFLLREKKVRGERRPVLLAAPMSVLSNWMHEAARFAPALRCLLHHGPDRWHGDSFAREAAGADVVLTSYALLHRDYIDLRKVQWAGIVLDEAQNIKNPDTRQSQAARALQADYRIALTGTPIENHVGDLWSIMDFLNPGLLGGRSDFRKRFFQPIQTGTDPGARARLRHMTGPFILRRLKTDKRIIADLPEKLENKEYCSLTLEQARLYQEVMNRFNREIDDAEGMARRGLILAVLTRLKQICNHPANYLGEPFAGPGRSGKLSRLEEMLEEVFAQGECALVFTQYAEMGHLLQRRLCQTFAVEMPFLHGGVTRKAREALVSGFQASVRPRAFILSLKAGGIGLNLTRATHVFHYDRWWNPAVEDQATDRAFRIGQSRRVLVHKMICAGTLEERIDRMIDAKTALSAEIVGSGERFLTELSNDTLKELFRFDSGPEMDA